MGRLLTEAELREYRNRAFCVWETRLHEHIEAQAEQNRALVKVGLILAEALQQIRDRRNQVCADFELCYHPACSASYTAFAIADAALRGQPEVALQKTHASLDQMRKDKVALIECTRELEFKISRLENEKQKEHLDVIELQKALDKTNRAHDVLSAKNARLEVEAYELRQHIADLSPRLA